MARTVKWDRSKGRPEPIAALNRVLECENGEPLVDLRVVATRVRILRPAVIPYLRKTVAAMLHEASLKLRDGVFFGVIDAYRPLERQQRIFNRMWADAGVAYPGRSHRSMRRTVCRFVAPADQPAPPGHCTGGAVDVHLIDEAGELVDVCSPYARFESAPTYTFGLDPGAQANRDMLVSAMLDVGFSNCRDEWWHYSYGDAGWAVRMDLAQCCYGLARLDPSLYQEEERLHVAYTRERPNPFLERKVP